MQTIKIIPRFDKQLNRVELFFPSDIFWSNTARLYLRIACWCEAEGHNECCLDTMGVDYRPISTLVEELIVEGVIKRYRLLYLSSDDKIILRKRVSKQEINRAR